MLVDDEDFILLSGDDASGLDFMQLGGKGVISVTANVAAREMAELCALAAQGQVCAGAPLKSALDAVASGSICRSKPNSGEVGL